MLNVVFAHDHGEASSGFGQTVRWGKNRVDQCGYAQDVRIEVEGETSEIHGRKLREMVGERDPHGVGCEIDGAPLLIAVAEVAEAAEQIAKMRDGDEWIASWGVFDVVVPLDDFHDVAGEFPGLGQNGAAVGVRET